MDSVMEYISDEEYNKGLAVQLLTDLENAMAKLDLIKMDYNNIRDTILLSVKGDLDSLDSEYDPKIHNAEYEVSSLTERVKSVVGATGESAKSDHLQAQYVRGRVSWNSEALEGYAAAHPEILVLKKVGESSVRIVKK